MIKIDATDITPEDEEDEDGEDLANFAYKVKKNIHFHYT